MEWVAGRALWVRCALVCLVVVVSVVIGPGRALASYEITGLSCPSASLCVGSDEQGYLVASTDPTGGPSTWSSFPVFTGGYLTPSAVSCSTTSFCVATSDYQIASGDPTGGSGAWRAFEPDGFPSFLSVSCASVKLCVAFQSKGFYSSTTPDGGAARFTESQPYCTQTSPDVLMCIGGTVGGVSCPSTSLCVAAFPGRYSQTTDVGVTTGLPGDPTKWSAPLMLDDYMVGSGISCPSTTLCVIAGYPGAIAVSTHPAAGAWNVVRASSNPIGAPNPVSCASNSLCLVSDGTGGVLTSTDPAGDAGTWQDEPVADSSLQAISCPSTTLCVATDSTGNVYTSTDPAAGQQAQWSESAAVDNHPSASTPLSTGRWRLSQRFSHRQSVRFALKWSNYIYGTRFKLQISKADLPPGGTIMARCTGELCPEPPMSSPILGPIDRRHLGGLRFWFGYRFAGGDHLTLTTNLGKQVKRFHLRIHAYSQPLLTH